MISFLARLLIAAGAVGLAVLTSWFFHARSWPPFVAVGIDVAVWIVLGSSLVGLFGGGPGDVVSSPRR